MIPNHSIVFPTFIYSINSLHLSEIFSSVQLFTNQFRNSLHPFSPFQFPIISSSNPVGGSSSAPPVPKNSKWNINDIAWKHGVSVDGGTRKIKCNYCGKMVIGGVYRLKHHLGHTQYNFRASVMLMDRRKKLY
jgi:hypothetical protein